MKLHKNQLNLKLRTLLLCWLGVCLLAQLATHTVSAHLETQSNYVDDCSELDEDVALQLGDVFTPLVTGIREYLEQGKPVTELHTAFNSKTEITGLDPITRVKAWVVDLEGDGSKDVAVTILTGSIVLISEAFIFQQCPSGKYSIHYVNSGIKGELVPSASHVGIIPARLRGNSSTQLIVSYADIQSGRCVAERLLIIGLQDSAWKTYLDDRVGCGRRDFTIVRRVIALDPDAIGRKNLMFVGDQWTGWGIFQFAKRRVRVIYAWEGDKLQFNKRVYLPSVYRFHVLKDADLALEAGNIELAKQFYEKAAQDAALINSFSLFEFNSLEVNVGNGKNYREAQKIAGQYQMAFARFRLMVLLANTQQPTRLDSMVRQLAKTFPAGKPGNEFSELSRVFQEEFLKSEDKQYACESVDSVAERQYPNLLGRDGHVGNWGDSGQGEFTIETACPQFTPP